MEVIVRRMRARRLLVGLTAIVLAALVIACGPRASTIAPYLGSDGFPVGTFNKEFVDPELGRVRLAWTFAPDGRWSEVPFALDGQTLPAPPIRGTYAVDGQTLTLTANHPPEWSGTSRHMWHMAGDRLTTTFVSSDIEGDADWFATLDVAPWVRAG